MLCGNWDPGPLHGKVVLSIKMTKVERFCPTVVGSSLGFAWTVIPVSGGVVWGSDTACFTVLRHPRMVGH